MVRIAVLGCGRIGRMHAANIAAHPRAELAGVFDVHRPAAEEVATSLGARLFDSAEAVLAAADVDAVLIATSTPTHADLLEAAVAAGKPALCEKPIDLSLARVTECAARIRGTSVPIMLGFVRRFDPGHRAVASAVRDGRIGALHQVAITSRDPGLAPVGYLRDRPLPGGLRRRDLGLRRRGREREPAGGRFRGRAPRAGPRRGGAQVGHGRPGGQGQRDRVT